MTVAAVHIAPGITVPLAVVLAGGLVWLWLRLGRRGVPADRRRVRRISIALMLLTLPALVRGASFVDPEIDPRAYLLTWTAVMLMIGLVLLTAGVDVAVSVRLHRIAMERELRDAADELARAIDRAEAANGADEGESP
jgi:hypothetical protein